MRVRWGFVIAGVAVVLLAAAPIAAGPPAPAHHTKAPTPSQPIASSYQQGLNVMLYRTSTGRHVQQSLRQWHAWHITDISLVFPLVQSGPYASDVGPGAITPSMATLRHVVAELQASGFRVMLRPLLDEGSLTPKGFWRGDIAPDSVAAWFASYQKAVVQYAALAQQQHVQAYDIGTELVSLQGYSSEWTNLIAAVRRVYHGQLLYSANWTDLTPESWFALLNEIGIDAYFPLTPANAGTVPSTAQLESAWASWLAKLPTYPRPLVITELGVLPVANSYRAPYLWNLPGSPYSPATQANFYSAGCQAWRPRTVGIYWWGVFWGPPHQYSSTSFAPTPQGADAIRSCFAAAG